MKEEWLFQGAVVPVDVETTSALVAEIHRLIGVVGGMALAQPPQRTWVGLTERERQDIALKVPIDAVFITEAALKAKNV